MMYDSKIRTSFKKPVCKKAITWLWRKPESNDKLYKKQFIPVITENKKHSCCTITHTHWRKELFAAAT